MKRIDNPIKKKKKVQERQKKILENTLAKNCNQWLNPKFDFVFLEPNGVD